MLTDTQIRNIHALDIDTVIAIMHECAERAGAMFVDEYCAVMGTSRRTVYQQLKQGKIKHLQIGCHKIPCINN